MKMFVRLQRGRTSGRIGTRSHPQSQVGLAAPLDHVDRTWQKIGGEEEQEDRMKP